MMQEIRVMIVGDHPVFRQGLRRVLEIEPDIRIECEATDGQEALLLARQHKPDVIIMDINLPKMNGIQATRRIKAAMSNIAIIVVTAYDYEEQIQLSGSSRQKRKNNITSLTLSGGVVFLLS